MAGFPYSLTVMYVEWLDDFGKSNSETAVIQSVCMGMFMIMGMLLILFEIYSEHSLFKNSKMYKPKFCRYEFTSVIENIDPSISKMMTKIKSTFLDSNIIFTFWKIYEF